MQVRRVEENLEHRSNLLPTRLDVVLVEVLYFYPSICEGTSYGSGNGDGLKVEAVTSKAQPRIVEVFGGPKKYVTRNVLSAERQLSVYSSSIAYLRGKHYTKK